MPDAIRLADKLAKFSDHWSPKIVASFNGHDVMVVKVKGELVIQLEDEAHLLLIEPKGTPNTGDAATAVFKDAI